MIFKNLFTHSLFVRVLATTVLVLVIPLCLFLIWFYNYKEKNDFDNSIEQLHFLSYDRASIFDAKVEEGFLLLDRVATFIKKGEDPSKEFEEIVKRSTITKINYISQGDDNQFFITYSSDPQAIGRDDTYRRYVKLAWYSERSVYLLENHGSSFLYITKKVEEGLLSLVFSVNDLIELMTNNFHHAWVPRFSLLTTDGIVFASNDPLFKGSMLFPLSNEQLADIELSGQFGDENPDFRPIPLIERKPFMWKENEKTRVGIFSAPFLVDTDKDKLVGFSLFHLRNFFLLLFIGVVLSLSITLFFVLRTVAGLKPLLSHIYRIEDKELTKSYVPQNKVKEIDKLGLALNELQAQIIEKKKQISEEKLSQKQFEGELHMGRVMQNALLPSIMPTSTLVELYAKAYPATEVGGDFYDFYLVDHRLFAMVADGAGKGPAACIYSLSLKSMLSSFANFKLGLKDIMQRANNLFIKEAEKSDFFVTIAAVTLDEENGECLYSSYGHQPCLIRRANGQIVTLAPQGIPMGIRRVETPYEEPFILEPSDLLILYTDGVTDCQNREKELFGEERFLEFVKIHGALPPKLFVEDLYQELMRFSAGEESFDDITVMAIKMGEKRSHV